MCIRDSFQYTEQEMARRVQRMRYQLLRRRGFDILLTHAPARGLYDGEDLPHRGFECFNQLMDKYAPRCFIHEMCIRDRGVPRQQQGDGPALCHPEQHRLPQGRVVHLRRVLLGVCQLDARPVEPRGVRGRLA